MRLTIRSKLYGSFTVLVLLMLLLGAVSWRASNKTAKSMEEMSEMFDASASSAELMGDMLMVRLKVKDYLLRNTEADYQAYEVARDAFAEDVATVRGQVAGTNREDEVASIDALFTNYDRAFEDVKVVIDERNEVFDNRLNVIGPRMASAVEAYQYDLIDEGALENIRLVSQLVNSVFDARLETVKYRQTSDENNARQTVARLQKGLESVDGLVAVETNAGDKQKLEDIRKDIGDYLTNFKRLQALASRRDALVVGELDVIGPEIAELGVRAFESLKEDSAQTQTLANETLASSVFGIEVAVAFSAVFAMVLAVLIGRSVTRPIAKIVASIKDIAQGEGDLTKRVELKSKDELSDLANWFNTFVQKLHDIIAEVSGVTSQVTQASMQIAASNEEMSSGLSQQTEQVMQMSSAIEEMSASVTEVARKCGEAANNAADSGRVAEEGGAVVSKTIQGIQSIRDAVNASASSVQELGKRGDRIGEIIAVINDIADQTNLLALNAAIEAARAGEHGRGFAVVADEVRKLADRTTTATQEIAESITAIQSETSQAVDRMNSGSQEVEEGVGYATSAGDSLQQIVAKAHDVADMIGNIAAAAEQQSAASEQISRSIDSITAVSSQSSASSNDAAASAVKLSKQAEQLQQLVGQFKLSV